MVMKNIIYIKLLDEVIDTWRPTYAEKLANNQFKILPTEDYDPNDEEWEFLPGTIVKCEIQKKDLGRGKQEEVLVAISKIE